MPVGGGQLGLWQEEEGHQAPDHPGPGRDPGASTYSSTCPHLLTPSPHLHPHPHTQPPQDETVKITKLTKDAARHAYTTLAHTFVRNGFNYLILSVKRDFDVERSSIVEVDYLR